MYLAYRPRILDTREKMPLLGEIVPDFEAETNEGKIKFHDWLAQDDKWTVLFSHPADFTPVCTTELAGVQRLVPEFQKRNVKLIALSCDSADSHRNWIPDIKKYGNLDKFEYPIIADPGRDVATKYGMMDPAEKDKAGTLGLCDFEGNKCPLHPNSL